MANTVFIFKGQMWDTKEHWKNIIKAHKSHQLAEAYVLVFFSCYEIFKKNVKNA